jgi:hypothetical protein
MDSPELPSRDSLRAASGCDDWAFTGTRRGRNQLKLALSDAAVPGARERVLLDKISTRPAPGNHEYLTSGASGYYGYFGAAAGDPTKGYYSYELGSWHIVVLNTNCSPVGGCGAGSPQSQWLRADLAAYPTVCALAYWHHPRFSFGTYSDDPRYQALWQALYEHGAEIVLSGHDHNYQRHAPQTPNGARDDAQGSASSWWAPAARTTTR